MNGQWHCPDCMQYFSDFGMYHNHQCRNQYQQNIPSQQIGYIQQNPNSFTPGYLNEVIDILRSIKDELQVIRMRGGKK